MSKRVVYGPVDPKRYLCQPFPEIPKETVKVGGVAMQAKRTGMVKLELELESASNWSSAVQKMYIFVRASDADAPWAKEIFDIDGRRAILVPEDRAVARCIEYGEIEIKPSASEIDEEQDWSKSGVLGR